MVEETIPSDHHYAFAPWLEHFYKQKQTSILISDIDFMNFKSFLGGPKM